MARFTEMDYAERQELARAGRGVAREENRAKLEFERAEREAEKLRKRDAERLIARSTRTGEPPYFPTAPLEEEIVTKRKGRRKKKRVKKLRVGRIFERVAFAKEAKPYTVGLRRRPTRRREEPTVREIVTEAVHREPEIPDGKKTDKEILDEFFS